MSQGTFIPTTPDPVVLDIARHNRMRAGAKPCPACNGEGYHTYPSDLAQTAVDVWPADIKRTCDWCDGTGVTFADFDADDSGAQVHQAEPDYEAVFRAIERAIGGGV